MATTTTGNRLDTKSTTATAMMRKIVVTSLIGGSPSACCPA
ncbi:MAG: hypothetical protein U1E16_01505 [Hyphomicrobiales bacterium]